MQLLETGKTIVHSVGQYIEVAAMTKFGIQEAAGTSCCLMMTHKMPIENVIFHKHHAMVSLDCLFTRTMT
jgi:hypothetical protein